MNPNLEALIQQFEEGTLTRRELILALTAASALGAALPATAEDAPAPLAFDPRSPEAVILARLANMKFTVGEDGAVKPLGLVFPESDPLGVKNWLFHPYEGLLSNRDAKARKRIKDPEGDHEGVPAGKKIDDEVRDILKVASACTDLKLLGGELAYKVMRAKFDLVEEHEHQHGREFVVNEMDVWLRGLNCPLPSEYHDLVRNELDRILALPMARAETSHSW